MTKNKYTKRMLQHEKSFEILWRKMVNDTNEFIKDHPTETMYNLKNLETFTDNLCLSGAWIQDRLEGKRPKDRGSVTKKIRKALGFIMP